jgi:hypothetical protein
MTRVRIAIIVILLLLAALIYTQITIFVVPPIGAVPEGGTIILWRYKVTDGNVSGLDLRIIDSADATCQRLMGGVNLLCRGLVLGKIASDTTMLMRLPYSSTLHALAEGG